jgi:uncharacterized protein with ParB-like and HNH nuclease domain
MKAGAAPLLGVLQGMQHFVVPLFQRPYSWSKDNWATLWGDILETYETPMDEALRPHFLGSIVTKSLPNTPTGVSPFLLIDGQQRLTTLTVLLAALRDSARVDAPELAEKIHEVYLVNKYAAGLEKYKVLPTQADRPAYSELIAGGGTAGNESRVMQAYRYFINALGQPSLTGAEVDLRRLEQVITSGLELVSITLDDSDNEYRIFESLNATGQPLTQADLLRNYFLMRVPADQQESVYGHLWLPMQNALGSALADFFRYRLMSSGEFVREGDVYYEWKRQLEKLTTDQLVQQLEQLARESAVYRRLIAPGDEPDLDIRQALTRLNRWGAQTIYPFLLNLYWAYDGGSLDRSQVVGVLQLLESFLVRRLFANVPTNALNRLFLRLWQQLPRDRDVVTATHEVLSEPGRRWPNDDEFRRGILYFPLYLNGRPDQRRLILESLEENFGHKEQPLLDSFTIEHVMPQSLTAEWATMLGPDARETHRRLLHTLGNLTLTGYNPELSNSPFAQKRVLLAKSNLAMNKEIAEEAVWTAGQIEARAQRLAERALGIWPSPLESIAGPTAHGSLSNDALGLVRQVLTRIEMPPGQQQVLGALYAVGDGALSTGELAEQIGRPRSDFRGIFGALGRRINNTPRGDGESKPGVGLFFEIHWSGSECHYRMLPVLREALEIEVRNGTLPRDLARVVRATNESSTVR